MRGIRLADGIARVDLDLEVQVVVLEQDRDGFFRVALIARELFGVGEADLGAVLQRDDELALFDAVLRRVGVRAVREGRVVVEERARIGDHLRAALRIELRGALGAVAFIDCIGAVERVVEAAPARVGGVERIAQVRERHDELRAGLLGDFAIDIGGARLHMRGRGHDIADFFEKLAIGARIAHRAGVAAMPVVELGLKTVALGEQRAVFRREIVDDGIESLPEGRAIDARAGDGFFIDELREIRVDLKAVLFDHVGHGHSG